MSDSASCDAFAPGSDGGDGGGGGGDGGGVVDGVVLESVHIGEHIVFYQKTKTGEIWHHSSPLLPVGRLTGPFGGASASSPAQLGWSMNCKLCKGHACRLVKSNKQLGFQEELLIKWLLGATISSLGLHGPRHKAAFGKAPFDKM